ncbi:uncharacterized protein LOC142899760 [Nelusetta ayraudi]|uniref:uncharacterized protein LOC142899760 n=1 Tax=Nelusetta ayraudi TaxID=303726 RepID=UPI003F71FF50
MTFKINFFPLTTLNRVPALLRGVCCWCTEGGVSACRGRLRRFLLLKLATVLLLPGGAQLPLLAGCVSSLRALPLLRSSRVSTKPSTVLLDQLALADGLLLLRWMLQLGVTLLQWTGSGSGSVSGLWWTDAVSVLCQQLLDAHQLVSLLLLGLLGLEATLVSHWPQQTRHLRTSRRAQLSCRLVWTCALLELLVSLNSKHQTLSAALANSSSVPLSPTPLLPAADFSALLRRTLWLANLWLHYTVLQRKPQKTREFFH